MDFEIEYSSDQERFRTEVRSFLESNVPAGLVTTAAVESYTADQYRMQRELGRKLGGRGWLYPQFPREYGGGGLDLDHVIIIDEELERLGLNLPPYYDSGGKMGGPTILVWGTEEQKQHFLPPIFKGEVRTWQLLTEPGAGSDLAGVTTRAIRDGDDYVVNGQKVFVGSNNGCEWMWTIAVTDPEGPRHKNLSWFMIDSSLPGITMQPLELLTASGGEAGSASGEKQSVFFDDVRVPANYLVGGENNGWTVASTHLEVEHGGTGNVGRSRMREALFAYCQRHHLDGKPMTEDPDVRELLMDLYIETEITRLYGLRNYYLAYAKQPRTYEGPQYSAHRKASNLRLTRTVQQILGYYALTTDPEYVVGEGHIEFMQRAGIVGTHPGGTIEVQKLIMARRIGIGSTPREKAGDLG